MLESCGSPALAIPAGVTGHDCALCRSAAAFSGICCSYSTLQIWGLKMKHPVLWYLSAKCPYKQQLLTKQKCLWEAVALVNTAVLFVASGILGFFPYFLVTVERLGTHNGNKYSLQAAQARSEHWALNQCSEQLSAFVIQSKRNKGGFASIWAYYHPEGKTNY